jgi:hypothetical protein
MNQTLVSTVSSPPARRSSLLVASFLVAIVAFGFRFTSLRGFSNDHFVLLARAQAMLAGDLPIRDYTEEGVPLSVLLTAGAQLIFGQSLFAEALIVFTSFAIAAGVTCWLTARVTGSRLLGMSAALLQILVYPRSYSHPKMLLYSVFLLCVWWYLNAPNRVRLAVLAVWTAIAFLIRHDHGVYLGLGSAAAIIIAQCLPAGASAKAGEGGAARVVRSGLEYAVVTLLCIAPYLVYVQYQQGLIDYFRTGLAISRAEASRTRFVRLTPDPFPDGSWISWQPADLSGFPGIRVRWKPEVDDARRQALEGEIGLLAGELDQERTWKYQIEPPGRETLSRLLARAEVEDTSGFDRRSLTFDEGPGLVARLVMATRLDRLRLGPRLAWFFTDRNVALAFFVAIWTLPIVATLIVLATRRTASATAYGSFIIALSALVVVSATGLLRESLSQRIPDIYGSLPMLVACAIALAWRVRPQDRGARLAAGAAIIALSSGFVLGTFVLGTVLIRLDHSGITRGPGAVWEQLQGVFRGTREWPWSGQWPASNGWKVARYVHDCTKPDDRLLVTWFAPEMNVFSRRAFAGGETALLPLFRTPALYEPAVVARLEKQSVPIVLVDPDAFEYFESVYPAVGEYIDERYHKVGQFSPDERPIDVYVDRTRTRTGTDAEFGWPCFVSNEERRTKN